MQTERRKHARRKFAYKVICASLKNPRKKFRATLVNISLAGIGLKIKRLIEGSESLKLLIFQPGRRVPIEAKGRLVWQGKLPDTPETRAGIQFTEIPWTQITSFLEDLS